MVRIKRIFTMALAAAVLVQSLGTEMSEEQTTVIETVEVESTTEGTISENELVTFFLIEKNHKWWYDFYQLQMQNVEMQFVLY